MSERRIREPRRAPPSRDGLGGEGFGLIETLVALTIAAFGMVAVAGLHVAVVQQQRVAAWRTGQTLAAQQVFEEMQTLGFNASSRSDTVSIGGVTYTVSSSVSNASSRVRQVVTQVSGVGSVGPRVFTTRVYRRRAYPIASP